MAVIDLEESLALNGNEIFGRDAVGGRQVGLQEGLDLGMVEAASARFAATEALACELVDDDRNGTILADDKEPLWPSMLSS